MLIVFIEPSLYSKEAFGLKNRSKFSQIIVITISYRSLCYAFYECHIFIKNYIPERVYGTCWHNAQRGPNNRWDCLDSWTFFYSANLSYAAPCTLVEILGEKAAGWGLANGHTVIHTICWSGNHRKFLTHKICARQKRKSHPRFKIRAKKTKQSKKWIVYKTPY